MQYGAMQHRIVGLFCIEFFHHHSPGSTPPEKKKINSRDSTGQIIDRLDCKNKKSG